MDAGRARLESAAGVAAPGAGAAREAEGARARPRLVLYRRCTDVPAAALPALLKRCDEISEPIWDKPPDFYEAHRDTYINADSGLVVAETEAGIVGFNFYRRLRVDGRRIVYTVTTAVMPEHRGRGLRTEFMRRIVAAERAAQRVDRMYLAVRTRNPVNWRLLAGLCRSVVPPLVPCVEDPELPELGRRAAALLFPDQPVDVPSMVMRGAYAAVPYREEPRHPDPAFEAVFRAALPGPADALFSIGELRAE